MLSRLCHVKGQGRRKRRDVCCQWAVDNPCLERAEDIKRLVAKSQDCREVSGVRIVRGSCIVLCENLDKALEADDFLDKLVDGAVEEMGSV